MDVPRFFHDVSDKFSLDISLHIGISIIISPKGAKRTRFEKNVPNLLADIAKEYQRNALKALQSAVPYL
jgi:hypothetical protein